MSSGAKYRICTHCRKKRKLKRAPRFAVHLLIYKKINILHFQSIANTLHNAIYE